ncbi:MAG: cysteine--tRNA ligase [Blastocatellia bacterium]|nr:cysteine--tRNA ligase [Blastocatellia bacterium]
MLTFFNTLSRQVEEFHPLEAGHVRMYGCGPTVYDYAHIGNFRSFLFIDLLRRYLKYSGYKVTHVMNITDIDDKTIERANRHAVSLREYTEKYTRLFLEDLDHLGAERPEIVVAATDHIEDMVELIKRLETNGHIYTSEGSVYFRISSLDSYGKLSGAKLEGNRSGARVDVDEYEKEDARDFVLWKSSKPGEPHWSTPYGEGRPGWHLECSAMAMRYLGESFDIHCGGVDLIFPHHENEIAQSEGATGKPFVRYWLHCEHLLVEGQKMSKSLGNFYTLRDLLEKGFSALAIRYLLISAPYRKQLNFTLENLRGVETRVKKLVDFKRRLKEFKSLLGTNASLATELKGFEQSFRAAMDDDLNSSAALAVVADFETTLNRAMASEQLFADEHAAANRLVEAFDSVLGLFGKAEEVDLDAEVQRLIDERVAAKAAKNYARADEIRKELAAKGIVLEDTKAGTRWRRA